MPEIVLVLLALALCLLHATLASGPRDEAETSEPDAPEEGRESDPCSR